MTKREAEELIEIEIDGTEKQECTEERYVLSLLFEVLRLKFVYLFCFFNSFDICGCTHKVWIFRFIVEYYVMLQRWPQL